MYNYYTNLATMKNNNEKTNLIHYIAVEIMLELYSFFFFFIKLHLLLTQINKIVLNLVMEQIMWLTSWKVTFELALINGS